MKNMKGGAIVLPDKFNIHDLIQKYKDTIKIESFGGSSIGGYLYKLIFQNIPEKEEIMSINPGEKHDYKIISNVSEIILKIVQIRSRFSKASMYKKKEVVTLSDFNEEVKMQNDIYNKSMDTFCEPICPNIIADEIIYKGSSLRDPNNLLNILNEIYINQNPTVFTSVSITPFLDDSTQRDIGAVGLIFMESKTDCKPIASLWSTDHSDLTANDIHIITSQEQRIVLDNFIFQLIRLANLGYSHRDPHLNNALFIKNYNYIDDYRVYLIDFGRTQQKDPMDLTRNTINNLFYMFHVAPRARNFWSYQTTKYLFKYISVHGEDEDMVFRNKPLDIKDYDPGNIKKWYQNKLKKNDISRKIFLENLYKINFLDFFKKIKSTHSKLISYTRLDDSHLIFSKYGMDSYIVGTIPEDIVLIVNTDIDGSIIDDQGIGLYINPAIKNYKMDLVKVISEYEDIYSIISFCKNEEINDNVHAIDQDETAFIWIIGMGDDNILNIYFMEIKSGWRLANNHIVLCSKFKIKSYYAAGEMKANKKENTLTFNLFSDTGFMKSVNIIPDKIDKLRENILIPVIKNKTKHSNILLDEQITDLDISLFDKNFWLKDHNIILKQHKYLFLGLTSYIKDNYSGFVLFAGYKKEDYDKEFVEIHPDLGGNGKNNKNDNNSKSKLIITTEKISTNIVKELQKGLKNEKVKQNILFLEGLIKGTGSNSETNNNSVDEEKVNLNEYNKNNFGKNSSLKFGNIQENPQDKSNKYGGKKRTKKIKRKLKNKSKKSLIGKQDFGSWKNGSSVFKDKKGFYVVQWNPKKNEEYKKYLTKWKPKMLQKKLTLKNKKWTITKSKKSINK
tara:strand:- start:2922 stop:5450 length:2529 start_codon:yes stop_codon:yes gene_type:complete